MNLFDQASLVVTPNGYKAGKLYSIKPDTGAGDLDVVRATGATRVNENGLIETVGNNVPRIDYPPLGGCPSILVEPAATNLVLRSEEFDGFWTAQNGSVTANTQVAPDGTMTADTFTSDGGSSTSNKSVVRRNNVIPEDSLIYTRSVFVKKGNTRYCYLSALGGSFTTARVVIFDFDDEVFSFQTTDVISSSIEKLDNGWYRIKMAMIASGGTFVNFSVGMTNSPTTVEDYNNGDTVHIWGAQLETGSVATSYIPTVASTVTRAADVISQDLSGVLPSTYSLILKVNANGGRLRMDDGTTGFDIDLTGTGQIVANVEANTITFNFPDNGQPLTELVFEKYTDFNDLEFVQKLAGLNVEVIAMTNSVLSASEIADKVLGSVSTSFIETDWGAQTNFNNAFRDRAYQYFPVINTSLGTGFISAFFNNNLKRFPFINTSSATSFISAWSNNNLQTFPANMFDNCTATNYTNAWFINALDATGVNNILISINKARVDGVSSGTGTIGITGGTNAAPTGAGLTAKNELIAAGWTVNTN